MTRNLFGAIATALILLSAACCSQPEEVSPVEFGVSVKNDAIVGCDEGVTSIYLTGPKGCDWVVEIVENDEKWCGFDSSYTTQLKEGKLGSGVNTIFLYHKRNAIAESRTATFKVTFKGNDTFELSVTQLTENIFSYHYNELPAYDDDYIYTSHYTSTHSGRRARNYSVCYDTQRRISLWVAYPLHECYTVGENIRVDDWSFDPNLALSQQHNCTEHSYKSSTYDRGHQIPSADRDGTREMNKQTFFMTNTTPQNYHLNRYLWASIESQVRSWMCADTLYVVTGPYYDPAQEPRFTTDNDGRQIEIPTHYFKALLRTREGNTSKNVTSCTSDELKSICFWVPNNGDNGTKITTEMFRSVDEVESMIGFDLFPKVTSLDESSCSMSDWGY